MILGVTGTNGAGKGAAVDFLVERGFTHYSVRTTLANILKKESREIDRSAFRDLANDLRKKHGADYLIRMLFEECEKSDARNAVIESVRTVSEAEYLKARGGVLLAIDATRELRYARIVSRNSTTDHVNFATFIEEEEREWYGALGEFDMNLMDVMKLADATILNNGSLESFFKDIQTAVDGLSK